MRQQLAKRGIRGVAVYSPPPPGAVWGTSERHFFRHQNPARRLEEEGPHAWAGLATRLPRAVRRQATCHLFAATALTASMRGGQQQDLWSDADELRAEQGPASATDSPPPGCGARPGSRRKPGLDSLRLKPDHERCPSSARLTLAGSRRGRSAPAPSTRTRSSARSRPSAARRATARASRR